MTDESEHFFTSRELIEECEVTIKERLDFLAKKRAKREMPEEIANLALYRVERLKFMRDLFVKRAAAEKEMKTQRSAPEPETPPPGPAPDPEPIDDFDD